MTRSLNRTVLAGGVVYPAGTPATPDLEARITNPGVWDGRSTAEQPKKAARTRKSAPAADSATADKD